MFFKEDAFKENSNEEIDKKMPIKIYGMAICPYCNVLFPQLENRGDEFQFLDIGEKEYFLL